MGKTYLLDTPAVRAANWTEPKGFGGDVGHYVPQFLIGVAAGSSGSDLTITLSTAFGGVQDSCNPTTQVTASGASYPDLQISAATFPMRIKETEPSRAKVVIARAHDLLLTNVLPGDSAAKAGELQATVDIRELYPLFYQIPNATQDSVCSTLASAAVACQACAFDQQPYCLTLKAVQIGATQVSTPVVQVSADSIDPSCS